ncbi:ervatamin-B-like [Lotus japonicus]|uniref:ervatamin-B-like n=1 Tax=Lotus japonicus TaxID=34305 RepID=UPI00258C3DEE|nr:ervatamin-B-like [Lotus japonicus]
MANNVFGSFSGAIFATFATFAGIFGSTTTTRYSTSINLALMRRAQEGAGERHVLFCGARLRRRGRAQRQRARARLHFDPLPAYDWRIKGVVNEIKDQLEASCCWAFAAVGVVESLYAIFTGLLVRLSEQELMDCCYGQDCCDGEKRKGQTKFALEYIKRNGISMEEDYPYEGVKGTCRRNTLGSTGERIRIDGYQQVPANDKDMQLAVERQPVAVKIRVPQSDLKKFFDYEKGVVSGPSISPEKYVYDECLTHGMVIVALGHTSRGCNYWVLRNSWGPEWGIGGYMLMRRNPNLASGTYNINTNALYPTRAYKFEPDTGAFDTT